MNVVYDHIKHFRYGHTFVIEATPFCPHLHKYKMAATSAQYPDVNVNISASSQDFKNIFWSKYMFLMMSYLIQWFS